MDRSSKLKQLHKFETLIKKILNLGIIWNMAYTMDYLFMQFSKKRNFQHCHFLWYEFMVWKKKIHLHTWLLPNNRTMTCVSVMCNSHLKWLYAIIELWFNKSCAMHTVGTQIIFIVLVVVYGYNKVCTYLLFERWITII